jgi:hypothetical protein
MHRALAIHRSFHTTLSSTIRKHFSTFGPFTSTSTTSPQVSPQARNTRRPLQTNSFKMTNPNAPHVDATTNFPTLTTDTPGEQFEVRQTATSPDYKPDPSKSLPLDGPRQALIVRFSGSVFLGPATPPCPLLYLTVLHPCTI